MTTSKMVSKVRIQVLTTSSEVDSDVLTPEQVNLDAPYSGPFIYTLIAGPGNNQLVPPANATGLAIFPAKVPVADLWIGNGIGPPFSVQIDPTREGYIPIIAGTPIVSLCSTLGGDVLLQWT